MRITLKTSKTAKVYFAKLGHLVPFGTLLDIYQPLIVPYFNLRTTCLGPGLQILSRQTVNFTKTKKNEHTVPLFINANPLTLNFLYYKNFSELMHDVRNASAPPKLRNLFTNTSSIHSYNTRPAASNKRLRKTIKA